MDNAFAELGLNEQILAGVESLGFTQPTPVQEQAIPLVLEGRDLVASAQTGTGKTAAFALPTLQRIMGITLDEPPAQPQEPVAAAQTEAAQAGAARRPPLPSRLASPRVRSPWSSPPRASLPSRSSAW